jgi:hypothetical protein
VVCSWCVRGVFVVCSWCVRGVFVVCSWCVRGVFVVFDYNGNRSLTPYSPGGVSANDKPAGAALSGSLNVVPSSVCVVVTPSIVYSNP